MPYLNEKDKEHVDMGGNPRTAGELNYIFTMAILQYVFDKGESYQTYNDVIGALECAGYELYRRKVGPYEDLKKTLNGEVYK
jgi:hypothetical protein